MISGGVVGWEKAEDVPCSCLCIMSLYFAYKMIMQGRDAPARYERVASMAPASSSCFPVNFVKFQRTPFSRTPPGDYF